MKHPDHALCQIDQECGDLGKTGGGKDNEWAVM